MFPSYTGGGGRSHGPWRQVEAPDSCFGVRAETEHAVTSTAMTQNRSLTWKSWFSTDAASRARHRGKPCRRVVGCRDEGNATPTRRSTRTLLGRGAFLRLFDLNRTQGRPSADDTELLRAAVVFAVGALDSMLHDLILEVIPRFGGDSDALRGALASLNKDDPGLALRLHLPSETENREEAFRSALDSWLGRQSFQGAHRLTVALTYVGSTLTLDGLDVVTRSKTGARLQHFTDQRHSMAHRGASPKVARDAAGECVDLVSAIAEAVNKDMLRYYNG